MGAVRRLVDELRGRGVTVHEWAGWDGRGNADGGVGPRVTQIEPVGAVIHHTGSPFGAAYAGLVSSTRPELLGGCLCNFAGNEDGSLTVIASGLAWHAGAGVGPSLGRVLSKVPNIRSRMNRVTVGLEIVYPGTAPMRPVQYRTALVFARAVADLFAGGDVEAIRAHAETNGNAPGGARKWDPGYANGQTIDMAAFRRDAANLQEDEVTADDIAEIVHRVLDTDVGGGSLADFVRINNKGGAIPEAVWAHDIPRPAPAEPMAAGELLGWMDLTASQARDQAAAVATLAAQRAGLSDADVQKVAAAITDITAEDVANHLTISTKS